MELDDLREINVGGLDGRSDERAWDTYARVLAAWKAGETEVRFPGGEDHAELCPRLRRALAAVARSAGDRRSLLVAHGANLRAALPGLPASRTRVRTCRSAEWPHCESTRPATQFPLVQLLTWPGGNPVS